jgi:integrase
MLAERRFLDMLRSRYGKEDIGLYRLSPVIIEDYFQYLKNFKGQNNNTACKSLKTLRSIILFGIRLGVIVSDPYIGIVHHLGPVKRTYLTDRELHAVIVKKLGTKRLERVRDVFVFACYTGMYYCEISRLKGDDVVESCGKKWINTHRNKNGQPVFVPLLDKPLKLIRKYRRMRSKQDDDSLFPLKSSTKTNEYLKEIAGVCGINKNLTFRVARYTFATLALMNGVPEETIAVMLGHSSTRYTQIYAQMTNKKVLDDMDKYGGRLKKLGL